VIFMSHDVDKTINMKILLSTFEQLSGLKINCRRLLRLPPRVGGAALPDREASGAGQAAGRLGADRVGRAHHQAGPRAGAGAALLRPGPLRGGGIGKGPGSDPGPFLVRL
jgi:hypothetical protein